MEVIMEEEDMEVVIVVEVMVEVVVMEVEVKLLERKTLPVPSEFRHLSRGAERGCINDPANPRGAEVCLAEPS